MTVASTVRGQPPGRRSDGQADGAAVPSLRASRRPTRPRHPVARSAPSGHGGISADASATLHSPTFLSPRGTLLNFRCRSSPRICWRRPSAWPGSTAPGHGESITAGQLAARLKVTSESYHAPSRAESRFLGGFGCCQPSLPEPACSAASASNRAMLSPSAASPLRVRLRNC